MPPVTGNNPCGTSVEVTTHDASNPAPVRITPGLEWAAVLRRTTSTLRHLMPRQWQLTSGSPLVPATLVAAGSGWDAAHFDFGGATAYVGNPGCTTGKVSILCIPVNGCSHTMNWTTLGSNICV